MGEREAKGLAARTGGHAYHLGDSGGNIWLVLVDLPNGVLLVLGDEGYEVTTRADFEAGREGYFMSCTLPGVRP
jgi:hypothetical protein